MTARAFEIDHRSTQGEVRNRYPEAFATTLTRYRLDVVASSVDDVVVSAGGWLFDRAMAGWEVNLLIAEPSDARPLQILGISTLPWKRRSSRWRIGLPPTRLRWPPMCSIAISASAAVSSRPLTAASPKSRCGVIRGRPGFIAAPMPSSTDSAPLPAPSRLTPCRRRSFRRAR